MIAFSVEVLRTSEPVNHCQRSVNYLIFDFTRVGYEQT